MGAFAFILMLFLLMFAIGVVCGAGLTVFALTLDTEDEPARPARREGE